MFYIGKIVFEVFKLRFPIDGYHVENLAPSSIRFYAEFRMICEIL